MKRHLAFVFLPLICLQVLGQNPEIDGLRTRAMKNKSIRMFYCELCDGFVRYSMTDSAKVCLKQARAKKSKSTELLIRWELTEAKLAEITNQYDSARVHYDSAFSLIEHSMPSYRILKRTYEQAIEAMSYFSACEEGLALTEAFIPLAQSIQDDSTTLLALLYHAQFQECLYPNDTTHLNSIRQAEKIAQKQPQLLGCMFERLALMHYFFDRLPKTVEYLLLAENVYHEYENLDPLAELYITFANAYEELNDFERALQYLHKAKPLIDAKLSALSDDFYNTLGWTYYRNGEIDLALEAIKKSKFLHEQYSPGNPELAYPVGNLGLIYKETGMPDSAVHYSTMAVELFSKLGYELGLAEAYNNLGFVALDRGDKNKAYALFQKALVLAEGDPEGIDEMNALEGLYRTLQDDRPKEAFEYFKRFSELKIELLSKNEVLKALQLEAGFYREKHNDRVRQLEYESQLKSLEIERKNTRILLTSMALLIMVAVAGLTFYYWLQRKRMIRNLEEANEINQRIISMISHDFRGPLNNVKLTLELLQSNDMAMSEFAILSKDLYRQSAELALMFDSFVGWAISQRDGYVPARIPFKWSDVVQEVINLSTPLAKLKDIKINLKAHSNIQVETDRMASSLILRNLLSNAIKYSTHQSKIDIEYHLDRDQVYTTITDFGIGMSDDKLQKILTTGDGSIIGTNNEYGVGLGLRMVIKYVKGIGGSIDARSKEGEGTSFTVIIPMQLKARHGKQ